MTKVPMIALVTIQRMVTPGVAATEKSPAKPPVTEWIETAKPFEARDEDEANELESLKAARRATTSKAKVEAVKEATARRPESNQTTKETPPALEGAAREAKVKEIMSALTDDGKTSDGKPNVPAVNELLPAGTKGITAKERDALWAEVSEAGEGSGDNEELV